MSRFDEYVCSNDTPKTLCLEIERLREELKDKDELIKQLSGKKASLDTDILEDCINGRR